MVENDNGHPRRTKVLIRITIGIGVVVMLLSLLEALDFGNGLDRVQLAVLSGPKDGHNDGLVDLIATRAHSRGGTVLNFNTHGSLENSKRMSSAHKSGEPLFAIIQNGLLGKSEMGLELIAQLPTSKTFFVVGPDADNIRRFADLAGKRIGIGEHGGDTAFLSKLIFEQTDFKALKLELKHYDYAGQIQALRDGHIDLGVFFIESFCPMIIELMGTERFAIARFRSLEALARRFSFLRVEIIDLGHFDQIRDIPAEPISVLTASTVVLGNRQASRSQIVSLLSLLDRSFPGFIAYNRANRGQTSFSESHFAEKYFQNGGPTTLDRYAPWLLDLIELVNLLHAVLIFSVLFKTTGLLHRYRLWRIDSARLSLEALLVELLGRSFDLSDPNFVKPAIADFPADRQSDLNTLISQFQALKERCRRQSVSMFVPLGSEHYYRLQERAIIDLHSLLRRFQRELSERDET